MTHHAKASPARSTEGTGSSRGLFGRAFAARSSQVDSNGSGARSARRLGSGFAVLVLSTFAFALSAAPASAVTSGHVETISKVFSQSAHVTGHLDFPSQGPFGFVIWNVQVSTDETEWSDVPGAEGVGRDEEVGTDNFATDLSGLQPATKYFVRLKTNDFGGGYFSPGPYLSFTTLPAVTQKPNILKVNSASAVTYTTAKVSGEVERPNPANEDPALDVACKFEYISAAAFAARNEKQSLSVQATGGTFTLGFSNPESDPPQTTAPIPFGASAASIKAALEGLANIGPGGVAVTGGPVLYTIEFVGPMAARNLGQITTENSLTGPKTFVGTTVLVDGHKEGYDGASSTPCNHDPVTGANPPLVETTLTGLTNGTTYHFRLVTSNGAGADVEEAPSTFTTAIVTPPVVVANDATNVTGSTAHFSGEVTPGGTDAGFDSTCFFDFVTQEDFEDEGYGLARTIECTPPVVQGTVAKPVTADPTGLDPHTVYHVRLRAQNQSTGTGPVVDEAATFETEPIAPVVSATGSREITTTTAILFGKVTTNGLPTTYHFEYLTLDEYRAANEQFTGARSTPDANLAATDIKPHLVSASVAGLAPGTVYRFRLVATNAKSPSPVLGFVNSFRTVDAPAPDECPNAEVRAQQGVEYLPECRAYELVSPIKKYAAEAGAPHGSPHYSVASADGNAMFYGVFGPIETAQIGIQAFALGRRSSHGWATTNPLSTGLRYSGVNLFNSRVHNFFMADDMSKFAFSGQSQRVPGMPAPENPTFGYESMFLGPDNISGPDPALEWISRPQIPNPTLPPGPEAEGVFAIAGGSPDLSTVYFWARSTLVPEDAPRAGTNAGGMFEYSNGVLKSASTLPDGSESPGGARPVRTDAGPLFRGTPEEFGNGVSEDGSTLFFMSPENPSTGNPVELYVHRGGHSKLVSHTSVSETSKAPSGARFIYASADGNTVLFESADALTPSAPSGGGAYRYDVNTGVVSYLAGLGNVKPEFGGGVLAMSDDGSRFLFGDSSRIGVWNEGVIKTVAPVGAYQTSYGRSNPSGSDFVFLSRAPIGGANAGGTEQVYRYDVSEDKLVCVSCPPDNIAPTSAAISHPAGEGELQPNRVLSSDGQAVFFDTGSPLVPADVNQKRDVYEWTPNGIFLISSGVGSKVSDENSFFLDNSADGSDVFFAAANKLVPGDDDGVDDVYDARVDGGFVEPVFNPCFGEACRSSLSTKPTITTSATSAFAGSGNRPPEGKPGFASRPKVKVGTRRLVGSSLKLSMTVPRAGHISVSGPDLQSTTHKYGKTGNYKLVVPLSPAAKSSLKAGNALKLKVHLRFVPKLGRPSSVNFVITVKA